MAHEGLPKPKAHVIHKADLLDSLQRIDRDGAARARILEMETAFRLRVDSHVASLPADKSTLQRLSTSPYVLLFYARQQNYSTVSEIEASIIPAKVFSSMETSAGKMIELITLPVYGWDTSTVMGPMQSVNSALDGMRIGDGVVELATLKSGPRCLNDEMAENFADVILTHCRSWGAKAGVDQLQFTFGVLYGTPKQSNKKDWHILRNISEKVAAHGGSMVVEPRGRWSCSFVLDTLEVEVDVRIGSAWWAHLGGDDCALELWVALLRACVLPGIADPTDHSYAISDLGAIVSTATVPPEFNVSLLQESQYPWLFFVARHFCDALI